MQVLVTEKNIKDKLLVNGKFPYLILDNHHSRVFIVHSLGNTSPKITVYMITGVHGAAGEDYKGMMP